MKVKENPWLFLAGLVGFITGLGLLSQSKSSFEMGLDIIVLALFVLVIFLGRK